mmetsp:Transcript_7430/g.21079  ORF Transcript_7430/g.21079 Transcript_7430/m.21079 type:complete len:563 (+) Transcript_7430:184-1872(+)
MAARGGFQEAAAQQRPPSTASRMLRIEFSGQPYDWFNLDEMSDVVRSEDFANTLRENIVHYFSVPYDCQAIYDEDGPLNAPVDFARSLQRSAPYFKVYDVRDMAPEQRDQTLRKLQQVAESVARSQQMLTAHGERSPLLGAAAAPPPSALAEPIGAASSFGLNQSGGRHSLAPSQAPGAAVSSFGACGGGDLHSLSGSAAERAPMSARSGAGSGSGLQPAPAHDPASGVCSYSYGGPPSDRMTPHPMPNGLAGGAPPMFMMGQQQMQQQRHPSPVSRQPQQQQQPSMQGAFRPYTGGFAENGMVAPQAPRAHSVGPPGAAAPVVSLAGSYCSSGARTPPPPPSYGGQGGCGTFTPPMGGGCAGVAFGGCGACGAPGGGCSGFGLGSGLGGGRFAGGGMGSGGFGGNAGGGFGAAPGAHGLTPSSSSRPGAGAAACSGGSAGGHVGSAAMPAGSSQWSGRRVQDGFEVSLSKTGPGQRFGFANVPSADGRSLLVTWVDPNLLLGDWNRSHPERAVREGDVIVVVNGFSDDAEAMRAQLQLEAVNMRILSGGAGADGNSRLTRA